MKKIPSVTATVGAAEASLIPTLRNGSDYSLYFHVPFCTKKCDYCHFYVIPNQKRYKDLYMQALKQEWELRKFLLPLITPLSIYFGGGTPSLIGPDCIQEILSWISPSSTCEITLEANPEDVTLEKMRAFRRCGINRVSIGVQSLDNHLLQTLSRTHTAQEALIAIETTYKAKIDNISIDLMYDLPGQSLKNWQQTVELALHLPIKHLSLYNLTIEPHTVFYKKRETLKLPDSLLSLAMLTQAVSRLEQASFARYEISAFAKNDSFSRHNVGYWTGRPFFGFGPSACSYWEGARFRNIANLSRWAKKVAEEREPIDFKERLDAKESLKEKLALSLRLIAGISLEKWPSEIEQGFLQLKNKGLLETTSTHLRLTPKGLLFHDTVAEEIMSW